MLSVIIVLIESPREMMYGFSFAHAAFATLCLITAAVPDGEMMMAIALPMLRVDFAIRLLLLWLGCADSMLMWLAVAAIGTVLWGIAGYITGLMKATIRRATDGLVHESV